MRVLWETFLIQIDFVTAGLAQNTAFGRKYSYHEDQADGKGL